MWTPKCPVKIFRLPDTPGSFECPSSIHRCKFSNCSRREFGFACAHTRRIWPTMTPAIFLQVLEQFSSVVGKDCTAFWSLVRGFWTTCSIVTCGSKCGMENMVLHCIILCTGTTVPRVYAVLPTSFKFRYFVLFVCLISGCGGLCLEFQLQTSICSFCYRDSLILHYVWMAAPFGARCESVLEHFLLLQTFPNILCSLVFPIYSCICFSSFQHAILQVLCHSRARNPCIT